VLGVRNYMTFAAERGAPRMLGSEARPARVPEGSWAKNYNQG